MSDHEVKEYTNGEVTIIWNAQKCTHSGHCVRGLPSVFDVNNRPWINILGANTGAIRTQVLACPSGALSLKEDA